MNTLYEEQEKLRKEFQRQSGIFERIRNGEIYLCAHYIPCACVSGLSPGYVLEYKDDHGVGRIYEESASIICKGICYALYKEAIQLYEKMKETKIFVCTSVYSYLDLKGMVEKKLAKIDLKKIDTYLFYAVYCSSESSKRVQSVYEFICRNVNPSFEFFGKPIGLQEYFTPELEECVQNAQEASGILEPVEWSEFLCLPQFLDSWILFLKERCKNANQTDIKLLKDAVQYQGRAGEELEVARYGYKKKPELYREALCAKELRGDYAGQMAVGKEALDKLDTDSDVRSEIALLTARAAFRAKEYALTEHYCAQALASNGKPGTYLLASALSHEPEKLESIAIEELKNVPCPGPFEDPVPHAFNRKVLQFFLGDFHVLPDLIEKRNFFEEYMECVAALLLSLLVKGNTWKEGCLYMVHLVDNYIGSPIDRYVRAEKDSDEEELFQTCLLKWKERHQAQIDEIRQFSELNRLEGLVRCIVKENISMYNLNYRRAAGFAAALGELKESLGEKDGKQRVLAKCRADFIKELIKEQKEVLFDRYKDGFPHEKAFDIYLKMFGMNAGKESN